MIGEVFDPMNYTYIVQCNDGSLYTGWTKDLGRRVETHNLGKGARYTRSRRPVRLVYYEEYDSEEEARKREYAIKRLNRKEKMDLIEHLQKGKRPPGSVKGTAFDTVICQRIH